MWNDIETTIDYIHFSVVAKTVADLIIESGDNPISIGVSGSWGSGKSSMVKMVGKELMATENPDSYVFLEFNAWLYQGYDDAKTALLQVVAQKLGDELKKRKVIDTDDIGKKFKSFVKRINWFQVSKMAFPLMMGVIPGAAPAGTIMSLANAIRGSISNQTDKEKNTSAIKGAFENLAPEIKELIKDEATKPATEQIEELRKEFEDILEKLKIKLVVLVDDLDRCLPETSIATLEAMRLLLFVKHTAFVIAADEQMIRNGVRAHFANVELSDGLETSYFDKLIQVPITVPHLGIAEIKVYMVLLFLELEVRRKNVKESVFENAQNKLEELLSQAWITDITRDKITQIFDPETLEIMNDYISTADQIAGILASADKIKGNPRLIKRFLNALEIRKKVVAYNGMTVDSELVIKMLLFERCASVGAFDYLLKKLTESQDGTLDFIKDIEEALESGKEYKIPDVTWDSQFIKEWLKLSPKLSEQDLRPVLYLSRDRGLTLAAYDELSPESQKILESLKRVKKGPILNDLVEQIKSIGNKEGEMLLNRISTIGRNNQWNMDTVSAALHITEAYPILGKEFVSVLAEIPARARKPALIPLLYDKDWAKEIIKQWSEDSETPDNVKKAIEQKNRR